MLPYTTLLRSGMGAGSVGDQCVIGMGAEIGDGVVVENGALVGARAYVEPGTIVKAGYIWAGRPATEFRRAKPEEQEFFQRGKEAYVDRKSTRLNSSHW